MPSRGTSWRQGDLLTTESAVALNLVDSPDARSHRVIVITHDCDLANPNEPTVEVIVARLVPAMNPQYTRARQPRVLHVSYATEDGELCLELKHSDRHAVKQADFSSHALQDDAVQFSDSQKRILKQWLAGRYGRVAFPGAFENRLRKRVGRKEIAQSIAERSAVEAAHLIGLFFDLGEFRNREAPEGEPYVLDILVVYDAQEGGSAAREAAERVAEQLRRDFLEAYGDPESATEIALESCTAVADTKLTIAAYRRLDEWRLEYISLTSEAHGDVLLHGCKP